MRKFLFFLAFLVIPVHLFGQTGANMPFVQPQFFAADGVTPCNGCQLFSYAAGTTTPQATYADSLLVTPNANPLILNSTGRPSGSSGIYMQALSYKFVLEDANSSTIWTRDNIYDFGQFAGLAICPCTTNGVLYATNSSTLASSSVLKWNQSTTFLDITTGSNTSAGFTIHDAASESITLNTATGVAIVAGAATSGILPLSVKNGSSTALMSIDGTGLMTLQQKPLPLTSGGTGNSAAPTVQGVVYASTLSQYATSSSITISGGDTMNFMPGSNEFGIIVQSTAAASMGHGIQIIGNSNLSTDEAFSVLNASFTRIFEITDDAIIRMGTLVNAANSANFTATKYIQFIDTTGTVYYIPARLATW
jgi:hypothetical protein